VAWLKRNQQPQADKAPESTVVVGDDDLAACDSALGQMEEALLSSSDAAIRTSARAIAWAGGVRPPGDLVMWVTEQKMRDPDGRPLDRPWYWIAAVADEALRRGDARLPGRIGFFLYGWSENIAPKMGMADELDCGGLWRVPQDAYATGLGHAICALAAIDSSEIIVSTTDKAVLAGNLLPPFSQALLQLEQAGVAVDPNARATALQTKG
jgi:hypothetical protein